MQFELVRERVAALPRELPEAPAVLTPIRLDTSGLEVPGAVGFDRARGRPAAVLVLLFPDAVGEARVLLTVRVSHLPAHAGEVSFPGGSAEEDDLDPIATALREAREEVGLDPEECGLRVAGVLETFGLTVSGFSIHPIVAVAEHEPALEPSPAEVARVIAPPVDAFLPESKVELEERMIRERLIRYGVYPVEGERVWGATARMLGQLGAGLAGQAVQPNGDVGDVGASIEPLPETAGPPHVRPARTTDDPAIRQFLDDLAPELARGLPPATELLIAEVDGGVAGLASWAAWGRDRGDDDARGFEGLTMPDDARAAELTLLAVAPQLRGRGVGRDLVAAAAAAAAASRCDRLFAWTLADAACHPSALTARRFFRANGFRDLAVDRSVRAGGEDRLLLARPLP